FQAVAAASSAAVNGLLDPTPPTVNTILQKNDMKRKKPGRIVKRYSTRQRRKKGAEAPSPNDLLPIDDQKSTLAVPPTKKGDAT
ncbi:hypothetical protein, partial [Asaia krungthepensis]